jgi:hypothetical protein
VLEALRLPKASLSADCWEEKTGMARDIPIGARGEAEETVEFKHTLSAHHPQLPPVYSTPDMIRLMETAAFRALQPYSERRRDHRGNVDQH